MTIYREGIAQPSPDPAVVDLLRAHARPLTGTDREALGMRRRNRAAALAGQGWTPPKPLR